MPGPDILIMLQVDEFRSYLYKLGDSESEFFTDSNM
jgi:hypothetical protein